MLPAARLEAIIQRHGPLKRAPAHVGARELLIRLVYHVSQPSGTFSAHLAQLTGKRISDCAASESRQTMPWEVFQAVLAQALTPLADPLHQPKAFYAGLRLVGMSVMSPTK